MALQVLIGGQDYTQYVDHKSFKIESNIAVDSDTGEFDVVITNKVIARPKGGQEVKVINGSRKEFAGVVLTPKAKALATTTMKYDTQCQDYKFYFNKRVVVNTYTGWTAGNIVKDIIQNFTTGFTSNNVQGTGSSFLVTEIKFDHVYPSDAIKKLADMVGFQYWIDYEKDVHFGPLMLDPSPLPNNTLLPDTDTENYSDLEIDEDVSQVRNQIYLQGFKIPADYSITQNFVADGQADTFYTTYEPMHRTSKITVTVGGVKQKIAADIAGGLPNDQMADGTCYVGYTNMSYRFNVSPAQGDVVSITYQPMFEMVSMYNDPNAMTEMKQRDNMDGVYEYAVRDQQLTSIDQTLANTRGQLELYKYAYPHISGQFNSFLQGWEKGQYFYFTSDNWMDGELQKQVFYVVKVDKTIVNHPQNGTPTLQYTVYFSDSPYVY